MPALSDPGMALPAGAGGMSGRGIFFSGRGTVRRGIFFCRGGLFFGNWRRFQTEVIASFLPRLDLDGLFPGLEFIGPDGYPVFSRGQILPVFPGLRVGLYLWNVGIIENNRCRDRLPRFVGNRSEYNPGFL